MEEIERALGYVLSEARTIEKRLATSAWLVGEGFSAADIVVFPGIQMLLREPGAARGAGSAARGSCRWRRNFPAIAAWIGRVEALPGYERTVSAALERMTRPRTRVRHVPETAAPIRRVLSRCRRFLQ